MKDFKTYITIALMGLSTTSCESFLDTAPQDALSPSTFWKSEKDVKSAVTACYSAWYNPHTGSSDIFFSDCTSDIGYNHTGSSNYKYVGNGSLSQAKTIKYYDYSTIRICTTFLENVESLTFLDETTKKDYMAQARTIRAWRYFQMNFWYGGVPLITKFAETATEAQVARNTEAEVKEYVYKELDAAIPDLAKKPAERGRIARGTALAIKMRASLYWGDYAQALDAANKIKELGIYSLDSDYLKMFSMSGQDSKEIICAMQHVATTYEFGNAIRLFNNQDGGWASFVPTQNLIDMFEMANGKSITEKGSGYDPIHPFANRDPRLYKTVVYPGMDWVGSNGKTRVFNTLDKNIDGKKNADYYDAANNSSKSGMIWAKYTTPLSQYSPALDNEGLCPIVFRYAEVLLTIAEADVELNKNLTEALDIIDMLRKRGGQIPVDRARYNTQDAIRELVRRERCIELAGEGLRRADIVRWKDKSGKMVAETVLNGTLYHMIGTIDYKETDPTRRAIITLPTSSNQAARKLEDRIFKPFQRYLPIPQAELDRNSQLVQNEGYK
uniref:RagB/SusD family nutrient uptake outer membrane protein n=1 Tax=Prevotella sp. GTC17254 TaxID=3236794 RepID=A0AB33IYL4_9BACT